MKRPVCECCGSIRNLDVIEITPPEIDSSGQWIEDCLSSNLILLCADCEKKLRKHKQTVLLNLKHSSYDNRQEDPRVQRYCPPGWAVMKL